MGLCGTADTHCCWMSGVECQFVQPRTDGFKWKCMLRAGAKDWPEVHHSAPYQTLVRPKLRAAGVQQDCGDWPPAGVRCNDCGEG